MALAFKRKYIDLPVDLAARVKVCAAEALQSERVFIANAVAAHCDAHAKAQAKKPAKSGPTIQNRKRKK